MLVLLPWSYLLQQLPRFCKSYLAEPAKLMFHESANFKNKVRKRAGQFSSICIRRTKLRHVIISALAA